MRRPSPGWRTARFWKPLEIVAGCLALVLWLGAMSLWMYHDATRPTAPDEGAGRIHAHNTHGSIVYLNQNEKAMINTLMWAAAGSSVIDVYVAPFRRRDN